MQINIKMMPLQL